MLCGLVKNLLNNLSGSERWDCQVNCRFMAMQ
jgi:hypothetical protein